MRCSLFQRGVLGLTLIAMLGLAGCGDDEPASGTPSSQSTESDAAGLGCDAAKGKTVGFSEPLPDPNFAAIEDILTNALGKYGVKVTAVNANLDPGKQIGDLNTLLQQQVSVLIVNPVDPNATKSVLDQFRGKDIPIVALDTMIGGPYFTTVREDMQTAGAEGAKLLKQTVGDGKVAAIYGPPFAEILNWEKEGFDSTAKQIGLNVVASGVNQKITPEGAKEFADSWKEKYGADLKGIWTFNDVSAIGVASSLDGTFKPAIVSINGQPDVVPLIKDGKVLATFAVPYEKTGQSLAYAALAALCGREMPQEVLVPLTKLDKSNVDSFRPIEERVNDPFDVEFEERDGNTYVKVD
jgi:ribose transport system substrate-binding protein